MIDLTNIFYMQFSLGKLVFLNSLMPFISVFLATVIMGFILIPILRLLKAGQSIRDDGPKTHLGKSGTPTFGGLMFLIPLLAFAIFFPALEINKNLDVGGGIGIILPITIFTMMVGLVGFIDDFIKVKVCVKGLSASAKSVMLLSVIIVFTVYYLYYSGMEPYFYVPFTGAMWQSSGVAVYGIWKLIYGVILVLVLYATTNSVNMTDGVDGLASLVTFISAFSLGIMGSALGGPTGRSAAMIAFAISAGCLGFFMFNRHPAKIFMGDTGSQALGAGLAASAIFMGLFWIILLIGIVYVMESLSVIIQVAYFKKTGQRIFKMAPLHHHFELSGWGEWKICIVFSLITIAGSFLAYLSVR